VGGEIFGVEGHLLGRGGTGKREGSMMTGATGGEVQTAERLKNEKAPPLVRVNATRASGGRGQ